MTGKKGKRWLVSILVCLCAIIVVTATLVITSPVEEAPDSFPGIGYKMSPTLLSEAFNSPPSDVTLTVDNATRTQYAYTNEGLRVTFNQTSSSIDITKSPVTMADSVRCVVNTSALDDFHVLNLFVNFKVQQTPWWNYGVTIKMLTNMVYLIPKTWLGTGTPVVQNACFLYDVQLIGTLDIVVEINQGNVTVGVNGFQTTLETNYKVFTDLTFDKTTLSTAPDSQNWSSPADIVLERFEIGSYAKIVYHDRLHKTITPWGYDFTLALQIHADYATPAQLNLLKYLADVYGVKGVFSSWMDTPDSAEYSVLTSANYKNALLALQSSGWEIGVHAVTQNNTTAPYLLKLIGEFGQIFGPLHSWVDHGGAAQDMYLFGDDPNSSYYIADYIATHNITVWVNDERQSHSMAQDLNLDSVMYHNATIPGLNLMHVSRFGFLEDTFGWQEEFAPVTQAELGNRQRIYAANSDVLIWHDYTWRFMFVEEEGIKYARESESNMGYPYELITPEYQQIIGANVHPNGTWYLKPFVEEYFAAMKQDYNVWYATPDEVYDRSLVTDKLIISEDSAWVNITNPTMSDIAGLTLYAKEHPSYSLANGNTTYLVHKGAENYQFVIPQVPAGGSISLAKVKSTSSVATMVETGSIPIAIMAYMNELSLRTIREGDRALLSNMLAEDEQSTMEIGDVHENTNAMPFQSRNQIEA